MIKCTQCGVSNFVSAVNCRTCNKPVRAYESYTAPKSYLDSKIDLSTLEPMPKSFSGPDDGE